jgi:tripartite ATP-independent transporter DctM subunit
LVIFLLFTLLLLLGVPIIFALLVPAIAAFVLYPDLPIQLIQSRLGNSYMSSTLMAVPLFIFAAQILTEIKITDAIFGFVNKLVGHVRGGLAHVNVLASVIFAGMSGSMTADAASLGKVEIEAMNQQGYPKAFSAAVTAASATIGPVIPPSIPAIIYGAVAEVSIGKLLIGGFLPGIIMAIVQMIQIALIAKRRGFPKTEFARFQEIRKTAVKAIPGLITPVILVGGMLFGFFTPIEAATVAVVYAMVIGFSFRTLTLKRLWHSFRQASLDSAAMLVTFIAASLIGLLVTRLHMADALIEFISGFTTSPVVLLILVNIFLIIAGCLLDPTCLIILCTPVLAPLVQSFGIDLIHFGIIMLLNIQVGVLTPPMGPALFVICRVAELKLNELLKEIWPFIIGLVVALLIVTYMPQTVLWLPNLFIKYK